MASLSDLLHKTILLVSSVDSLKAEVSRMNSLLMDHHDRIVKLEGNGDLVAEKARNAALQAVNATSAQLIGEVTRLQCELEFIAEKNPGRKKQKSDRADDQIKKLLVHGK